MRRRIALICRSRHMFFKVRFSFAFYPGNLVFFSWNLSWNSLSIVEKNKFISLPIKFHANRSKFQFCTTTTRSKLIKISRELYCRVCVFFFLNPAAEIMLSMLFYTLLNTTPHNTQKSRRRKEATQ